VLLDDPEKNTKERYESDLCEKKQKIPKNARFPTKVIGFV
jgi:hypothetical protein